ncbi:Cloroperoxidase [Aaosphaeria arxii CBS 175.79]|uniref:Cloroperoxidase n=1 Tax=Aaosphaeria arxii CBS 175.79 TaxID=1450172 RepID=A0A6A5XPS4_9PLEO|nr:Cloroperoxidase [Aaosphaeria arxii CBS 175.79]KAF2015248.1 Cloroperoxidase [Aaosphaeria arxii CBS 175.79]
MTLCILAPILLLFVLGSLCNDIEFHNFHPPYAGDLRSPCPALNALANHHIIPHDGRNLTVPMLVKAFNQSMNISDEFTNFVATAALPLAPDGGKSGTFSLQDIQVHGGMEHDGSLSRKDFALGGDANSFSPSVFQEFLSFFHGKEDIGVADAARARWGRIESSRHTNPNFTYTEGDQANSYIQSAIYLQALRNDTSGEVPVEWLKIWFEEERLPYNEGWRPTKNPVSSLSLLLDVLKLALYTPEKLEEACEEGKGTL